MAGAQQVAWFATILNCAHFISFLEKSTRRNVFRSKWGQFLYSNDIDVDNNNENNNNNNDDYNNDNNNNENNTNDNNNVKVIIMIIIIIMKTIIIIMIIINYIDISDIYNDWIW